MALPADCRFPRYSLLIEALLLHTEDVFLLFKRSFTRSTVCVPSDPLAVATCTTEFKRLPPDLSAFRIQRNLQRGSTMDQFALCA